MAAEASGRQASSLIRSLRLKYFSSEASANSRPFSFSGINQQQGKPPLSPSSPCPPLPSTQEDSLTSSLGGLGVCNMTHEQLVRSLELFIDRQASLLKSTSESPRTSASGGNSSSSQLQREVLWLEGSLLLILVDMRKQARELQEVQEKLQSATRGPKVTNAWEQKSSSNLQQPTAPKNHLAHQMLKSLAAEKADLQKKLSRIEASSDAPLLGTQAHFSSYYAKERERVSKATPTKNGMTTSRSLSTSRSPSRRESGSGDHHNMRSRRFSSDLKANISTTEISQRDF